MASRESAFIEITPDVLLKAYACGIFPMAESADDPALYWIEPEIRGIIPLDSFHEENTDGERYDAGENVEQNQVAPADRTIRKQHDSPGFGGC